MTDVDVADSVAAAAASFLTLVEGLASAPDRRATLVLLRVGAAAVEAAVRSVRPTQLDDVVTVGTTGGTIQRLLDGLRGHVLGRDATIRRSIGR